MERAQLPDGLLAAVRGGDCVAFVGAGFAMPAMPGWADLLRGLADRVEDRTLREDILALLRGAPSAMDMEAAAEMLRRALAEEKFDQALAGLLSARPAHATVEKRRALLEGIPFAEVLTTNFDPLLDGDAPERPAFKRLLRGKPGAGRALPRTIVKLHGDVSKKGNPVVLSREDYRKRMYEDGRYASFLRTVFATRTVLFLGVSFTDAYLNELRSEVLALVGPERNESSPAPLAYAFLSGISAARAKYFRDHEGIEVVPYEKTEDHRGFDELLKALHDATQRHANLRALLQGRRVMWLDPHPGNNEEALQALAREGSRIFRQVTSLGHALELLDAEPGWDLILTHFGYVDGAPSTAERLLRELRMRERGVPVVVFAGPAHARDNRALVRSLGAIDYCHQFDDLYHVLEEFFRKRAGE